MSVVFRVVNSLKCGWASKGNYSREGRHIIFSAGGWRRLGGAGFDYYNATQLRSLLPDTTSGTFVVFVLCCVWEKRCARLFWTIMFSERRLVLDDSKKSTVGCGREGGRVLQLLLVLVDDRNDESHV